MKTKTTLLFDIGLIIKGIDSILEIIGGILLLAPVKVGGYLQVLSEHSSKDFISRNLKHLATGVQAATITTAIYLIVHGLIKTILIVAALKRKTWGYVALMIFLSIFAIAELARYLETQDMAPLILGLFDALLVVLIAHEYQARYPKDKVTKEPEAKLDNS